jgi:DNA-binding transcriptional LysR family regulator
VRVPDCSMDVLAALVAAAETKTKTEAAGILKISISALDKRLRTASFLYGAPLVEQSENELRLTEEGRVFYSSASRSIEFASLAEESVRTHLLLKMSQVLIGHSSYLAPRMLALVHGLRFEAHPRVLVKHRAALTALIARGVCDGQMLAGFGFLPLNAPELVIRKIWDEPLVACIPSGHSVANRAVVRPEDLDGQAVIAVGREPMPGMHEEMEDYFSSMGVRWKIVADAFAPMEALNLVEQEIGICILSGSSAVPHRGVTVRPLWTRALRRESAFFYREDNRSALLTELSRMVLERAEEAGRAERASGKRAG